jgi:hypothetical protein
VLTELKHSHLLVHQMVYPLQIEALRRKRGLAF